MESPEVQFQSDLSLATGRDCPIEMGDRTTSVGANLHYLQIGFAVVLYDEIV